MECRVRPGSHQPDQLLFCIHLIYFTLNFPTNRMKVIFLSLMAKWGFREADRAEQKSKCGGVGQYITAQGQAPGMCKQNLQRRTWLHLNPQRTIYWVSITVSGILPACWGFKSSQRLRGGGKSWDSRSLVFPKCVRGPLLWNHPQVLIKKVKFWTTPQNFCTFQPRNVHLLQGSWGRFLCMLSFEIHVSVFLAQLI